MEARIQSTVDELLDAVDDAQPFDLVAALTFPLPASIVFSFMGVPPEDWAQLKQWCGSRATLAWGRPAPEEQVEHARNMAAYRGYLRGLVASKADDRADDYASALLAIHDEDPEALSHEEIASILFSLSLRRPRDDEQPDRQPRPAAAGGAHALGGDRGRPRR